MPLTGFETVNPRGEQPQTNALDRAATGIGYDFLLQKIAWDFSTYFKFSKPAWRICCFVVYSNILRHIVVSFRDFIEGRGLNFTLTVAMELHKQK